MKTHKKISLDFYQNLGKLFYAIAAADKKVHQIAKLSNDVKELKSEYVDVRMKLMQSKMESKIIQAMEKRGLEPSVTPPQKILITTTKE